MLNMTLRRLDTGSTPDALDLLQQAAIPPAFSSPDTSETLGSSDTLSTNFTLGSNRTVLETKTSSLGSSSIPTKAPKKPGAGAAFFNFGTAGFGAGCWTSSWISGPSWSSSWATWSSWSATTTGAGTLGGRLTWILGSIPIKLYSE